MRFWKPAESGKETFLSRLLRTDRTQWIILLLLGVFLALLAMPASKKNEASGETADSLAGETGDREKTELEGKLENLLSSVEGVGKVKVLLMTKTGGDSRGFYSAREGTEVTGVLIAAEGAGNSVTVQNIQQAVMALFQVEAHKIKVMKMK